MNETINDTSTGRRRARRGLIVMSLIISGVLAGGGLVAMAASPTVRQSSTPSNTGQGAQTSPQGKFTPNVPGTKPSPLESVFVPITPCRIADTRSSSGLISHGKTRAFHVTGSSSFQGQGGKSGGCGIPTTATGVAMSVTAVGETDHGYVATYPTGATRPVSTAVSFAKAVTITGATTTSLGTGGEITAYVGGSTAKTQLIVDVDGYYDQQMHAIVLSDGTLYWGSNRILSATHSGTGSHSVTFDRSLIACNVIAVNNGSQTLVESSWSTNVVSVSTYQLSGGAWSLANASFQLYATC